LGRVLKLFSWIFFKRGFGEQGKRVSRPRPGGGGLFFFGYSGGSLKIFILKFPGWGNFFRGGKKGGGGGGGTRKGFFFLHAP